MKSWFALSLVAAGVLLAAAPVHPPDHLEYFLRWDRQDFLREHAAKLSWLKWLMPPAQAELPPQYQRAFSLYLTLRHDTSEIQAEWYSRMVMEPDSFRFSRHVYGATEYQAFKKLIQNQKLDCTSKVQPGWSGPSPEYLRWGIGHQEHLIFASLSPEGPYGPGDTRRGERHYLCSKALEAQLAYFRQDMTKRVKP